MTMLSRAKFFGVRTNESSLGDSTAPAAGSHAVVLYEAELKPLSESTSMSRKPMSGNLSNETPIPGLMAGSFTCKTYLSGSSAAGTAPPWGVMLIGAGFKQTVSAGISVTYAPASTVSIGAYSTTATFSGMDGLNIYEWNNDVSGAAAGKLYKLLGAFGNVKFSWKAGELPTCEYDYKGVYSAPTIVSFPAPTLTAHQAPVPVLGATCTFDPTGAAAAHTMTLRSLEIDMGTDVKLLPDANNASGYTSALIVDRTPTFKMQLHEPASYTNDATGQNWWTNFSGGVTGALEIGPLGTGAGRICNVTMPNVGFKKVDKADADGIVVVDIEGELATAAISTGDDEISIAFT